MPAYEAWLINSPFALKSVLVPIVSPRQIRLALLSFGITFQQIDDAINTLDEPDKTAAKIAWEYSIEFNRNDPLVLGIGQLLGKTAEELDIIWELAITL